MEHHQVRVDVSNQNNKSIEPVKLDRGRIYIHLSKAYITMYRK